VQGGGEAILVSKTWRQGDFEVFDFEVEGLHNFYVRGEGSGAAGVLVHNSTLSKGTLSNAEVGEIQAIAKEFDTTIDVVGSRAARKGRGVGTDLPVGKDAPGAPGTTRSDIDFRVDDAHPQHGALCAACENVGGGAGNASAKHSNNSASNGRETYPPYIRVSPDGSVDHVTK
jgi:hypothetical protein